MHWERSSNVDCQLVVAVVLSIPWSCGRIKQKAHPRWLLGPVCPNGLTLMANNEVGKALRFGFVRESRYHFRRSHRGRRNPELEEWRVKVLESVEVWKEGHEVLALQGPSECGMWCWGSPRGLSYIQRDKWPLLWVCRCGCATLERKETKGDEW